MSIAEDIMNNTTIARLVKMTINDSTVCFGRTINSYYKGCNEIFEHDYKNKKFAIGFHSFYEKCKKEKGIELKESEVLEKINSALEKIFRVEGYKTEVGLVCTFYSGLANFEKY